MARASGRGLLIVGALPLALLAAPIAGAASAPFVYEREALDRSGLLTLAEFLEREPWAGSGQSPRLNGGGLGTHTVDIGELGERRTEVRVDGRRWIVDLDGSSDLGAIPIASVERIVVARGGGAAGGTIDITLRAPVAGFEVRSGVGEFTAGDGRRESHSMRLGATGERGGALLEASYAKQEGLLRGDRAVSSVLLPGFDPNDVFGGASSTTPFGRFRLRLPVAPFSADRVLIPGRPGTSASDFRPYNPRTDGFNFAAGASLSAPWDQTALRATGDYAVVDGVTARIGLLASERRSEQRFPGVPLLFGPATGFSALGSVDFAGNAFNPFGVPLSLVQFRPSDRDRVFAQDTDTVVFDAGLEGAFDLFAREWRWHAGWRDADRERADTTTGFFDTARLVRGLGPSFRDATGTVRCGTPQAPIAGCVPINVFGGPAGFTPAMRDYAGVVLQSALDLSQTQYVAGLDGVLVELPAGPLALALDVEHRRESGRYTPDALVAARGTEASGPFGNQAYDGRIVSDRVDLGFDVPLLRDRAFVQSLDLNLGAEWLDDDDTGSENSPRVGLRWAPHEVLAVSLAWQRAARTPSLLERFDAPSIDFPGFSDPCSVGRIESQPAIVQRRCRDGFAGLAPVPPGFGQTSLRPAIGGGGLAFGLEAERATTRSVGFEFLPRDGTLPRAWLAWSRTVVDRPFDLGTAQGALDACYVEGRAESCRFLARDPSGEISQFFTGWRNAAIGLESEAWDFGVAFARDTRIGRFALRGDASYLSYLGESGQPDRGDVLADGSLAQGNVVGVFRGDTAIAPRLRAHVELDWSRGDWSATLGYRWRSALQEDCGVVTAIARNVGDPARAAALCSDPEGTPRFANGANRIAAHGTADLAVRWETPWDGQFALGIHNLFDRDPPVSYASGNGNLVVIDPLPGRAWWLSAMQRF
jgi:iron complex outermembrane receptor protein